MSRVLPPMCTTVRTNSLLLEHHSGSGMHIHVRHSTYADCRMTVSRWYQKKRFSRLFFVSLVTAAIVVVVDAFPIAPAMDLKSGVILIAPSIKNISCNQHIRYTYASYQHISTFDIIRATIVFLLTVGIIGANLVLIIVINHRRYSSYIHPQVIRLLPLCTHCTLHTNDCCAHRACICSIDKYNGDQVFPIGMFTPRSDWISHSVGVRVRVVGQQYPYFIRAKHRVFSKMPRKVYCIWQNHTHVGC